MSSRSNRIGKIGHWRLSIRSCSSIAFSCPLNAITRLKACRVEFERFAKYPSAVRRIMYTTNAIEAANSGFRKITKHDAFQSGNSVFKLLYLRVLELEKKGASRLVANFFSTTDSLHSSTTSTAKFLFTQFH